MKIWYIFPALLVFGLLMFVHELGHFLFARKFGVGVKEFSIGEGPLLFGKTSEKTGTKYSIRLFPIMAHVSMVGEDEESDGENAFGKKTVWQRMLIVIAGPLMNILVGFLAMILLVVSTGNLYSTDVFYPNAETESSVSMETGLMDGDKMLKVGNVRVFTYQDMFYEISHQGTEPVDVTVLRDGERVVVKDVVFPTVESEGILFGEIDFYVSREPFTFGNVMKHSFARSVSTVKLVVDSFVDLISGKYGIEAVSGPVGITETIGESVAAGWQTFLYIFIVITINLGVFNLFPFPALDGGRFLFLLIEGIFRKSIPPKIEAAVNTAGILLLLLLAVFVTVKDVINLF